MIAVTTELPLPPHFDPASTRRWEYRPDPHALLAAATAWRRQYELEPAAASITKIHLLIIDAQKDFCYPAGNLYVGGRTGDGALDDNRRLAEFIYRNLRAITAITATLDTHLPMQIFFSSFWVDGHGEPPSPHTIVSVEQIRSGALRPNPAIARWLCGGDYSWLLKHVTFYCQELARVGKYALYLWPYHCLLGSDGYALAGTVEEARLFHAFARQTQAWIATKGDNPLTENYSIFRPEVLRGHDGDELGHKNDALLTTLLGSQAIVIAGQAASHCVKSSIEDLLVEIQDIDPGIARRVYILEDCMSSVVVRDDTGGVIADFTDQASAALDRFREAGMNVVASTTPISAWPQLALG